MKVVKSPTTGRWMYDAGPHLMDITCHHMQGSARGACGGCYARAMQALERIAKADPADPDQPDALARQVLDAVRAEAPAPKGRRKS